MSTAQPSDPSMQSPAAPESAIGGRLTVSLAEIDAMGRKAARGAGYSWGLAEEAGRAARWLAAFDLRGPEALARLLAETAAGPTRHGLAGVDGRWRGAEAPLCPVMAGAALSDRAETIAAGRSVAMAEVLVPALVLPALCRAARDLETGFRLVLDGRDILALPEGPVLSGDDEILLASATRLEVAPANARAASPGAARLAGPEGRSVALATWQALDGLAARTYVPASDASRTSGAGAGTLDND